jgi:hypothetical protein
MEIIKLEIVRVICYIEFQDAFTSKSLWINSLAVLLNSHILGASMTFGMLSCTAFFSTIVSTGDCSINVHWKFIWLALAKVACSLNDLVRRALHTIWGGLLVDDHSLELGLYNRPAIAVRALRPDSHSIPAIFGIFSSIAKWDIALPCFLSVYGLDINTQ